MSSTLGGPAPKTPLPGVGGFGVLLEAIPDATVDADGATPSRDRDGEAIGVADPAPQPAGAGTFARLIGVVIFGLAAIAGSVLLAAARAVGSQVEVAPTEGSLLGLWKVMYASEAPSVRVAVVAVALAALLALGVALLELRITNRARRSIDPRANPLAPKLVMARTSGVFAGPVTVTVLIPAHNEEASLPQTIASLVGQGHPPERIIRGRRQPHGLHG